MNSLVSKDVDVNETYSIKEICELLKIPNPTLYIAIHQGRLRSYDNDGVMGVTKKDLIEYLRRARFSEAKKENMLRIVRDEKPLEDILDSSDVVEAMKNVVAMPERIVPLPSMHGVRTRESKRYLEMVAERDYYKNLLEEEREALELNFRGLALGVLFQAVKDIRIYLKRIQERKEITKYMNHQLRNALIWFASDSRNPPFSLNSICLEMDWDADVIRKRVKRMTASFRPELRLSYFMKEET